MGDGRPVALQGERGKGDDPATQTGDQQLDENGRTNRRTVDGPGTQVSHVLLNASIIIRLVVPSVL